MKFIVPNLSWAIMIVESVQSSLTTLFGVPFPRPTPLGHRDSQHRIMPKREIRMLGKATNTQDLKPLWQT